MSGGKFWWWFTPLTSSATMPASPHPAAGLESVVLSEYVFVVIFFFFFFFLYVCFVCRCQPCECMITEQDTKPFVPVVCLFVIRKRVTGSQSSPIRCPSFGSHFVCAVTLCGFYL